MITRILAAINNLTAATNRQTDVIEKQIEAYHKQAAIQNEASSQGNILSRRHLDCSEKRLQMDMAARFAPPPTDEEVIARVRERLRLMEAAK